MRKIGKFLGWLAVGVFFLTPTAYAASCPVAESVVSPDVARQATTATVGMIADRVSAVSSGIGTGGLSGQSSLGIASCNPALTGDGGDTAQNTANAPQPAPKPDNGVWVSSSATWIKKTDPSGEFSGSVETAVAGYDRKVASSTILGLAFGAETAFINTRYNAGTIRGRSISMSPYVGFALTDWLTLDATVGHAWVYYNYTDGSAAAEVFSDAHAGRWFGATDLTAKDHIDDVVLTAAVGYMRVSETEKTFISTNKTVVDTTAVNIGQMRATVGAGYDILTSWGKLTPSAFVRIQYEVPHEGAATLATGYVTSTDTTSAVFGINLDAQVNKVWTFNVFGNTEEFRQNTSARTLGLNARYAF